MRVTEINVNLSAVIPIGDYSNYRPQYSLTAKLTDKDNPKECLEQLREEVRTMINNDRARLQHQDRVNYLNKVRFYSKDGSPKLPSVTSIIGWTDFLYQLKNPNPFGGVNDEELKEYGARGTIIHTAIEHWFKTGKMVPQGKGINLKSVFQGGEWKTSFSELKVEELLIRDSKLKVEDCNWLGFWEKYGKDIEVKFLERVVYGKGYAGRLDAYGTWKGEPALFDWKTTSNYNAKVEMKYYKQLSAYAKGLNGVKRPKWLVIVPLNPSNKCGFGAPKITEYSDGLFNAFEQDVRQFNNDFKSLI